MALFRRSLKRCIPLILALVILVGTLPAVPASASGVDSSTGEITDTWEEIGQYVASGEYKTRYALGNYKTITLTDGTTVDMQIVAFDADTAADGSIVPITWISKGVVTNHVMNSTSTNTGGWAASEMRTWLQGDFYGTLPTEVKDVIVSVNKTYYDFTTKSTLTCEDDVWIPSYRELFGNSSNNSYYESDGADYTAFFTDSTSRIKNDSSGSADYWWLRSAYIIGIDYFRGVNSDGDVLTFNAINSYGVVLGFCTGASAAETYTHTVTIDGEEFTFTSEDASPPVTIEVTEAGCTMTYGSDSTTWTYSGDGVFTGLYSPSQDYLYVVGSYFSLMGGGAADKTSAFTSAQGTCATFVVGDQSYVFYGADGSTPEVTMDVTSGGVRLSSGFTSYFHEDANVRGYKLTESSDSYIATGESYVFSSAAETYSQTLYPVYSADLLFSTTVNIYDSSGTQLLGSYDFILQGSAPVVTLTVLGNGCKLVSGDTSYSWDAGSDPFYGFSPAMYVATAYYAPGNVYTLPGGDAVNLTINLFVHDTESSGLPAVDFVEWLKVAVGGFLDFEIFPGMSLDEILYFILVVQLLLWFLKVIS